MDRKTTPTMCAPVRYRSAIRSGGSCLNDVEVRQLAEVLRAPRSVLSRDAGSIRRWINAKLGTTHESQWAETPNAREALQSAPSLSQTLTAAFRPKHPEAWLLSPRAWLSNFDIEAVMRQYEDAYRDFRFVGVFPSDFSSPRPYSGGQCVSAAMCALSVRGLRADGIKHVSVVFNLDKHTGSGTHWTGLYIGLDPTVPTRFGAWYYDSTGREPMPEMVNFKERMRSEAAAEFPRKQFKLWQNRKRKQFKNTECGVYAMFFIVACISTGFSVPLIARRLVHGDDEMHRLRAIFFRPPYSVKAAKT